MSLLTEYIEKHHKKAGIIVYAGFIKTESNRRYIEEFLKNKLFHDTDLKLIKRKDTFGDDLYVAECYIFNDDQLKELIDLVME